MGLLCVLKLSFVSFLNISKIMVSMLTKFQKLLGSFARQDELEQSNARQSNQVSGSRTPSHPGWEILFKFVLFALPGVIRDPHASGDSESRAGLHHCTQKVEWRWNHIIVKLIWLLCNFSRQGLCLKYACEKLSESKIIFFVFKELKCVDCADKKCRVPD